VNLLARLTVSPRTSDDVPELKQLLLDLAQERDRCLKYGAQLSAWAMFWTLALVAVGAVVAAQGAFAKIWEMTAGFL
jgi:hypothetical protein